MFYHNNKITGDRVSHQRIDFITNTKERIPPSNEYLKKVEFELSKLEKKGINPVEIMACDADRILTE